jgi:hypothetical protein
MRLQRDLRTLRSIISFPFWYFSKRLGPDNHSFKKYRLKYISKKYNCETLIETGTFYGQTVKFATKYFKKIISIEIFKPLYEYNLQSFKNISKIHLFNGDSSVLMSEMISKADGRILFWLDGHYSGEGTGKGLKYCPIFEELKLISLAKRNDHCILIDDYRLFGTDENYPSFQETKDYLLKINSTYNIYIDNDCIIATPSNI